MQCSNYSTRTSPTILRHFTPDDPGLCELCGTEPEDIVHLLVSRCPAQQERKALLIEYKYSILSESETCKEIFTNILKSSQEEQVQFFLDCSAIPNIIPANQNDKSVLPLLFKVSRTWYSLHRTRLKLLGVWLMAYTTIL